MNFYEFKNDNGKFWVAAESLEEAERTVKDGTGKFIDLSGLLKINKEPPLKQCRISVNKIMSPDFFDVMEYCMKNTQSMRMTGMNVTHCIEENDVVACFNVDFNRLERE